MISLTIRDMFRTAGYKGYLSLEYEENGDATAAVPPLLAELNLCRRQRLSGKP